MKKATMKKATADDTEVKASPAGDTRALREGTVVFLPGSLTPLTLATDVQVTGERIGRDAKFAGMLQRHQNNWDLNIAQLEGTWNFATARREDDPVTEASEE